MVRLVDELADAAAATLSTGIATGRFEWVGTGMFRGVQVVMMMVMVMIATAKTAILGA